MVWRKRPRPEAQFALGPNALVEPGGHARSSCCSCGCSSSRTFPFSICPSLFLVVSSIGFSTWRRRRAVCPRMQGSPRCEHEAAGSTDPVPLRQSHACFLESTVGCQKADFLAGVKPVCIFMQGVCSDCDFSDHVCELQSVSPACTAYSSTPALTGVYFQSVCSTRCILDFHCISPRSSEASLISVPGLLKSACPT